MTARNPGPFLQQTPIGFPGYKRQVNKDWMARAAFKESEVNTRVYKTVYETLGIKGRIQVNKAVGRNRVRVRDIQTGFGKDCYNWTKMSRFGFNQVYREGWLLKYGYDPDRRH